MSEHFSLHCPITRELMTDPVLLVGDGHTYERTAISQWLELHCTSPHTGLKLKNSSLIPNHSFRNLIHELHPEHPVKGGSSTISQNTPGPAPGPTGEWALALARVGNACPKMGDVFDGVFIQTFEENEYTSTSRWTVGVEFMQVCDGRDVEVKFTWTKWGQDFEPSEEKVDAAFADRLKRTVLQSFESKARGGFSLRGMGDFELRSFDECSVGNGFFRLVLGEQGKTLDGYFFLRDPVAVHVPMTTGMGIFRMRLNEQL